MVHGTAMPGSGSGNGSGGVGTSNPPGPTLLTCSFSNCKAPSMGPIPFCPTHLRQLRPSRPQSSHHNNPPQPTPKASLPVNVNIPGQRADNTVQETHPHRPPPKLSPTTYVMRKSAPSTTSSRYPPPVSIASITTEPSVFKDSRAPLPRPVAASQFYPSKDTHRQYSNGGAGVGAGADVGAVYPASFSTGTTIPTPVESPSHTRLLTMPNQTQILDDGDDNNDVHTQRGPPGRDRRARFPRPAAARFSLDTYVYNQDASVAPLPAPPGVVISTAAEIAAARSAAAAAAALEESYAAAVASSLCVRRALSKTSATASSSLSSQPQRPSSSSSKPDYVYAYIDPRIHWTRPRSKEWHANKQAEIKARGGRKANVGMAAQRIVKRKQQQQQQQQQQQAADEAAAAAEPEEPASALSTGAAPASRVPAVWTGELPSDVAGNKAWTALLSTFARDEAKRHQAAARRQSHV